MEDSNVLISINFEMDFKPLKVDTQIITDIQTAIEIVRASKLTNVQLRQDNNGGVMEWDNF